MKQFFCFLLIVAAYISCKKDNISIQSFWNCNTTQQLDSAAIINKLAGSWIWKKQSCEGTARKADHPVRVTFHSNNTFTLTEDGTIKSQGTWKIVRVDTDKYGLNFSQPNQYMYGRILFCEEEVLFNDSYVDGCDNLFAKDN